MKIYRNRAASVVRQQDIDQKGDELSAGQSASPAEERDEQRQHAQHGRDQQQRIPGAAVIDIVRGVVIDEAGKLRDGQQHGIERKQAEDPVKKRAVPQILSGAVQQIDGQHRDQHAGQQRLKKEAVLRRERKEGLRQRPPQHRNIIRAGVEEKHRKENAEKAPRPEVHAAVDQDGKQADEHRHQRGRGHGKVDQRDPAVHAVSPPRGIFSFMRES